jgi:hypothetical protein
MINQFIDEVISKGAESILPQNLDDKWLDITYVASRNFLKIAAGMESMKSEEDVLSDENSLIMLTSITEIAQHQAGYSPSENAYEIPEDLIFEYISCYAMATILESIARESKLEIEQPTLENIFTQERLFEIEQKHPEITELLNKLITD